MKIDKDILEKANKLESEDKVGIFDYSKSLFHECKRGFHLDEFSKIMGYSSFFDLTKSIHENTISIETIEDKLGNIEFLGTSSFTSPTSKIYEMLEGNE